MWLGEARQGKEQHNHLQRGKEGMAIVRCLDTFMEQLQPMLSRLDRGDSINPTEIKRITGQAYERLEARIKSYFWAQGKSVKRRDGVPYILTDDEEVEQAVRDAGRSRRAVGRGVHRLGGVDRERLRPETGQKLGLLVKELTIVKEAASAAVRVMSRALQAATAPSTKRLATGDR